MSAAGLTNGSPNPTNQAIPRSTDSLRIRLYMFRNGVNSEQAGKMKTKPININKEMEKFTLDIEITGVKEFGIRLRVAFWLMRLAGHIIGVGESNIEIKRVKE